MCQTKQMTWDKLFTILIWVISQAFPAPHFVFWEVLILIRQYVRKNTQTITQNWFLKLSMTPAYFIPMLAMIICYSLSIRTLLCARSIQKNKSIYKVFSVVVLFILSQIPYTFFTLIRIVDWSFQLRSSFEYEIIITKALAYLYGCLNPLFFHRNENQEVLTQIIKKARYAKWQVTAQQWQTTKEEDSNFYSFI